MPKSSRVSVAFTKASPVSVSALASGQWQRAAAYGQCAHRSPEVAQRTGKLGEFLTLKAGGPNFSGLDFVHGAQADASPTRTL